MGKVSFRQMCIENSINYSTAYRYRSEHPELTDEQIIEYYKQPKPLTFKQKCIYSEINHNTANSYRHRHPELTDEQVINHFLQEKK